MQISETHRMILSEIPGPGSSEWLTVSEVAARLGLRSSLVSPRVTEAHQFGYVVRQRRKRDGWAAYEYQLAGREL